MFVLVYSIVKAHISFHNFGYFVIFNPDFKHEFICHFPRTPCIVIKLLSFTRVQVQCSRPIPWAPLSVSLLLRVKLWAAAHPPFFPSSLSALFKATHPRRESPKATSCFTPLCAIFQLPKWAVHPQA